MSSPARERRRLSAASLSGAYGVVDIGSNSIRLVVFDTLVRSPATLFNERVQCGLGRGIEQSHRLDPSAIEPALACLDRFVRTAGELGAAKLDAVATAAIREAEDGADFVREARRRTGLDIKVISGTEEARLSALGAASAAPGLTGLVGDLGGASLELVELVDGAPGRSDTLAIGPLRLGASDTKPDKIAAAIDRELARLPWLAELKGRSLHLVGGTWRALARLRMAQTDYPLPIIHGYRLAPGEAEGLAKLIANLSPKTMRRVGGVPRRRQDSLPFGALALGRLLARTAPSEVVFSAYGLREGMLYERLTAAERKIDPLLAGCADMSSRLGRGPAYGAALHAWLAEAFPAKTGRDAILRLAACDLVDVCWRDHPDYRAEHAFHQILRAPFVGLDHRERAFLATAVSKRYRADSELLETSVAAKLLSPADEREASALGYAMRLANLLSHGRPELLAGTGLVRGPGPSLELTLRELPEPAMLRRLERLVEEIADLLGIKSHAVRAAAPDAAARSA
ncbi:MAG: Ppx/GppA family phosphatase [Alphaproteobacteria bacterium]